MNETLQASELLRGMTFGFGMATVLVALGVRGLIGIAMARSNYDSLGRKLAWIPVIPFIMLGMYLIGAALFTR